MTKYFITKFALATKRIEERDMEEPGEHGYIFDKHQAFLFGRDAFLTKAEALAAAEEQKTKRLASLQKSIDKLKKVKFS